MTYKYFPIDFSSYEDYVKYLKEKGLTVEVNKCYNNTDVYSKLAFPTEEIRDTFYANF